mmetsp:Transcript_16747/g.48182  ORF Transcript_16747/g.48182 Transcript_16747/m.48182 type:complete len:91 (+) Transcript_16747:560-832(+)
MYAFIAMVTRASNFFSFLFKSSAGYVASPRTDRFDGAIYEDVLRYKTIARLNRAKMNQESSHHFTLEALAASTPNETGPYHMVTAPSTRY